MITLRRIPYKKCIKKYPLNRRKKTVSGAFIHLVATKADYNAHSEDVSFEIRQYLSQPVIPRHENLLKYWSSMKLAFPTLYKLAIKYVSIIGTSVPPEVFSSW
ncbi:unnamed protein product [Lasius platythorax]|uniref:HAT C-terminal dimerisation domain-containing protein n=1 Tax=Lasius platythorax TaxID=488582 RepID=A0AAV2MX43_9HYME